MPSLNHFDSSRTRKALKALVLGATAIVIMAALWATSTALMENVRFARGTNQILQLVAASHMLADRDKNFTAQPSEDVLDDLIRTKLIAGDAQQTKPVMLGNPWQGTVQAFAPQPNFVRIEATMPGHGCRRMAMFFLKNGRDLGLTTVEARNDGSPQWRRFYEPDNGIDALNNQMIEDACEQSTHTTIAFVFALR